MRFYYENCCGDTGFFSEKCLVKAIYTAWNIDADLYIVPTGSKKYKDLKREDIKIVFTPVDSNELNSELLKPYGYRMVDCDEYREIQEIKTGKIIKYNWSEIKQLI